MVILRGRKEKSQVLRRSSTGRRGKGWNVGWGLGLGEVVVREREREEKAGMGLEVDGG